MRSDEKQFLGHPLSVHVVVRLRFANKLLLLHSAILKPNSNLALRQIGGGRDASSFVFSDEFAGCVFFFKFFQLDLGVGNTLFASSPVTANLRLQRDDIWNKKQHTQTNKFIPGSISSYWKSSKEHFHKVTCLIWGSDTRHKRERVFWKKKKYGKNIYQMFDFL